MVAEWEMGEEGRGGIHLSSSHILLVFKVARYRFSTECKTKSLRCTILTGLVDYYRVVCC